MQRVVWADLHALTAPYAARQEVFFIQRARRTQQPFMALDCASRRASQQWNHDCPRRQSGEHLASLQVQTDGLLSGEKLELQTVLRTLTNTVQTEMTLRLTPRNSADGIIAALAAQQAAIAVLAASRGLDESKNRPARYDPEQSAQWAKRPAPEPSHAKIQRQKKYEDDAEPNPLAKVRLFETEQQRSENKMQPAAHHLHRCKSAVFHHVQRGGQGIVRRG